MKWAFTDQFADINRGTHISNEDMKLLLKPISDIRDAVGDRIEIANDGHGRWNLNSAIRIGKAMDHLDMMWQEELIQPTNVDSHLRLAEEIEAPICVSERLISKYQFREYLKAGAAEVVMPDLIWTGGITETKKIFANGSQNIFVFVLCKHHFSAQLLAILVSTTTGTFFK